MLKQRNKPFRNKVNQRYRQLDKVMESHPFYQLIFATSYINEELDKPEYTIGDFYTPDNKSLKNVDF
jgi:hypothetical protein